MTGLDARYIRDARHVARNFSRAAAGYDALAQFQQAVCGRLLERLDVIRLAPRRFADVGSGTGVLARQVRGRYRGSTGVEVDLAPGMLHAARPRWPWQRTRRTWVCADAAALPLADGCMDLVASNLMLQWCNEPGAVLAECLRVLRPGGLLLLSTLGAGTLEELRASWRQVDDHVHVNAFMDPPALAGLLAETGFTDMVLETECFTLLYSDGMALMRDLKRLGTGNVNAGRPRGLTGRDRLQRMLAHYESLRTDDRLPATHEVIYIHAWRPEPARPGRGNTVAIPVSAIGRRRQP